MELMDTLEPQVAIHLHPRASSWDISLTRPFCVSDLNPHGGPFPLPVAPPSRLSSPCCRPRQAQRSQHKPAQDCVSCSGGWRPSCLVDRMTQRRVTATWARPQGTRPSQEGAGVPKPGEAPSPSLFSAGGPPGSWTQGQALTMFFSFPAHLRKICRDWPAWSIPGVANTT